MQQHVEAPVTLPLADLLEPILDDAMFEANQNGKQLRLPPCRPSPSPCGLSCWRAPWRTRCAMRSSTPRVHQVEWYREGREWVMTIRDDGPGVPVEQQPRLFLPFFRVDDACNAKTGGTGLGPRHRRRGNRAMAAPSGPAATTERPGHHHPPAHRLTDPLFIDTGAGYAGAHFAPPQDPAMLDIVLYQPEIPPNTGNIIPPLCQYRLPAAP